MMPQNVIILVTKLGYRVSVVSLSTRLGVIRYSTRFVRLTMEVFDILMAARGSRRQFSVVPARLDSASA